MLWEFTAGVIGILSILVVTGNNFIIWFFLIVFNCLGVYIAFSYVEADHHSTAAEFLNMLKTYDGKGCEHENTLKAIEMLSNILDHHRKNRKNISVSVDDNDDESNGKAKYTDTDPLIGNTSSVPEMRMRKLHL